MTDVLSKHDIDKQFILGENFKQLFIDKILSLAYQLSSFHKKNKYRSSQTIYDIVSISKIMKIQEFLSDRINFTDLFVKRAMHDI